MSEKNDEQLYFPLDDGQLITIERFVMERSKNVVMVGYDLEETEDETIARHLLRARRVWDGSPSPHLILPEVPSRNGGLLERLVVRSLIVGFAIVAVGAPAWYWWNARTPSQIGVYAIPGERDDVLVEILNGAGIDGLAAAMSRQLRRHGIDVVY